MTIRLTRATGVNLRSGRTAHRDWTKPVYLPEPSPSRRVGASIRG